MKKKQAAFTLVEAIVSVAVLSIVLAMVYGVFFSLARSTVAGAEASVEIQRQRIALKTIEDSLSGLVYYEQSKEHYSFLADTTIFEYPSISFVSRVPPDFLGNKEFGSQRLRRIEFTVEDDEDLGRSLVMYQEALMQPVNTQDIREPKRWVLGPNLDTFFFVFWSTINNEWVSEWTETNSVPSRLKFELAFKGADGEAARIEEIQKREIVVFSESITQAMQNPPLPQARGNKGKSNPRSPRSSRDPRTMSSEERKKRWETFKREQQKRASNKKNDGKSSDFTKAQRDAYKRMVQKRLADQKSGSTAPRETFLDSMNEAFETGDNNEDNFRTGNATKTADQILINDALIAYAIKNDEPVSSLSDLEPDFIIPPPPDGKQWQYNPTTGEVDLISA